MSIQQQSFLSNIKTIQEIPAFVVLNQSKYLILVLHQHLGLVAYFAQMVMQLVGDQISVVIPDLFSNIDQQLIDQDDQFAPINLLQAIDVYYILRKFVKFAQNKQKQVVLMGFSIGAALGLKFIQIIPGISLGVFFYGYPITKNIQPEKISCPTLIFHSQKDKIKSLSDNQHFAQVQKLYSKNKLINIQTLSTGHGFMNRQSVNFDQQSFKICKKIFFQYLQKLQNGQFDQLLKQNNKNKKKKQQQQGGCYIY